MNELEQITKLEAPTFINSTTVTTLDGVKLSLWDITKIALSARLNLGLYGDGGNGKSQLCADVRSLMGNNATRFLARNDMNVKSLYRQLNFKKLVDAMADGGIVSQKDLTEITQDIYRPLTIVEEINRCAEQVRNQLFNIFEGFIEIDGVNYSLGRGKLNTFTDIDGITITRNVNYSVGLWTANYGNGGYTGTTSMDLALMQRSHLILDVDNFPTGEERHDDLDEILMRAGGEIRLKDQENPEDRTNLFVAAFNYMKQKSMTPDPSELGEEFMYFRYLTLGLDYIPYPSAKNSKRRMKSVWPGIAEENDGLGTTDDEKMLYRVIKPMNIRSALTVITLARAMREYVKAVKPNAQPRVLDSIIEAFKLVGAYSGTLANDERIREKYVANPYLASCEAGNVIKRRLENARDLMSAIIGCRQDEKPFTQKILDACDKDYTCFK